MVQCLGHVLKRIDRRDFCGKRSLADEVGNFLANRAFAFGAVQSLEGARHHEALEP